MPSAMSRNSRQYERIFDQKLNDYVVNDTNDKIETSGKHVRVMYTPLNPTFI